MCGNKTKSQYAIVSSGGKCVIVVCYYYTAYALCLHSQNEVGHNDKY